MKYESVAQTTTIIKSVAVEDFKTNPEIRRTRRKLLIVLSIYLTLMIIALLLLIFVAVVTNNTWDTTAKTISKDTPLAVISTIVITLICLCAFIKVVLAYSKIGILVFAWLTAILLVFEVVVAIIEFSAETIERETSSVGIVVQIIGYGIDILLSILIIVFSFKLVKLIKVQKSHQTV